MAKKLCGVKIKKKVILETFSTREAALKAERDMLAKINFSNDKSKRYLNSVAGDASCNLFSIKNFIDFD